LIEVDDVSHRWLLAVGSAVRAEAAC